ncbi:MAG: Ig-like domain-containing protein [Marinisporobacter sp.]|jgi:hypothetical protein|nr:Ig-like domain-containing protein [Marinisporobacter sp.]
MKNRSYFPFERNRYFYGKLLSVRDFDAEQMYFNNKRRLKNRILSGAGIVCGLNVVATSEDKISIESGMAIDYLGREIILSESISRRLSMIDGYESIRDKRQCYLYISYGEKLKEPVNVIANDNGDEGTEYSRVEESFELFLKPQEQSIEEIMQTDCASTYKVLYNQNGLTLIAQIPTVVPSCQEAVVKMILMKHTDMDPVKIELSSTSEYFKSKDDQRELIFRFAENPDNMKTIYETEMIVKAEKVDNVDALLFNDHVHLDIWIGREFITKDIEMNAKVLITEGNISNEILKRYYTQNLEEKTGGGELEICIARIDLMNTSSTNIIRYIQPVPFNQYLPAIGMNQQQNPLNGNLFKPFETTVRTRRLNAWEKPEADIKYNPNTNNWNFEVGIPAAQAYDYATSTGVTEILLGNGAKMNGRYVTEEISHGLGLGAVSINVSVLQQDDKMLFGNGDVFKRNEFEKKLYRLETAAVLFPDKGTFKIGVRFLDAEDIESLKLRWFAMKPEKDSEAFIERDVITIKVEPDIVSVKPRDEVRFRAFVYGTPNKQVNWSIVDDAGGSIDQNGIYKAASIKGTYEIKVTSQEDPNVMVSAFVVVNE